MKLKINLLWLVLIFPASAGAQTSRPCYADMRREGIALMNDKNYKDAINIFWSALVVCKDKPENHDLDWLRQDAQERWVSELESARARAQVAYQEALKAKEAAETAKTAEEKARKEAEENAKKAREQGIKAESLRLALQANMARQKGRKSDALFLSWMALQLSGPEMPPFVMNAFGEAVRDTFGETFFNSPRQLTSASFLPGGQQVLLQTDDHSWFVVNTGTLPGVAQLPAGITDITPSHKGNYLLVWGAGNDVQVLNTAGTVVAALTGHREPVRCAVFSPDDSRVLSCSRDNSARLWDLKGKLLAVLEGHTGNVQWGDFAPDGSFILTRATDGTARTWTPEGVPLGTIGMGGDFARAAYIYPLSKRVIAVFSSGKAGVYLPDGRLQKTIALDNQPVKEIKIAATLMVVRGGSRSVALFSAQGDLQAELPHRTAVEGIYVEPLGNYLLSWAADRVVRLWDKNGRLLREYRGHRGGIVAASISPDGKNILTTSKDGTAKLWDMEGNILSEWILGTDTPAFFDPEKHRIVAAGNEGKSLSFTPVPMEVYRSVKPEAVLNATTTPQLLKEYDVQFIEELTGKK